MKKISSFAVLLIILATSLKVTAQDTWTKEELLNRETNQSIITAMPFLQIGPDSRSGGMGEAGAATQTDVWSMHWNPAKYAFAEDELSLGIAYTPWLRNIGVTDVNLIYLAGYYKLDDLQTVAVAIRYFGLGEITFYDKIGNETGQKHEPKEYTFNGSYSRQLSDHFSLGLSGRFIYSNLLGNYVMDGEQTKPGVTASVDVGGLYKNSFKNQPINYSLGFNISNIGAKVGYSDVDEKEFIPTNLRLGLGGEYAVDDYNSIGIYADFSKLLVPTAPAKDNNSNIVGGKDDNVPVMEGIFRSFSDAPGGMAEEVREIQISAGAEYWYDQQFAVRAGYFHEHARKGGRKYYTLGLGLRMNVFGLDFAYLVPTDGKNSPLANTMRFSLTFDFEGLKDEQKETETL